MRAIQKKFSKWIRSNRGRIRHRFLDDFIFIHINKTGGSSIERALRIPFEHKSALEKIAEVGIEQWERKLTFAVIRNPWDKVVSHYHYRVQTNQTGMADHRTDFKEWVLLAYRDQDPLYYDKPKMFMPQSDWVSDAEGKILVDRICRFERLSEDFSDICKQLGKDVTLPHLKSSKRGHYRDYFDAETAAVVASWFRKDLENFNYSF